MSRKSIHFTEIESPITLTIKTKCPEKYLLIDRETGNTFVGKVTGEWELIKEGPHSHV